MRPPISVGSLDSGSPGTSVGADGTKSSSASGFWPIIYILLQSAILNPAPMSDKLNFLPASMKTLRSYSLLVLEGPDAVAFIQAQSMNDVKALVDGQWHWNGLLNPKGRVIALFALVRIRADLLYLVLPDFPSEKLREHLQRFIFRSKVKLIVDVEKVFAAEFNSESTSESSRSFISGNLIDGVALDFSSNSSNRRLWILPANKAATFPADSAIEAKWRDLDIEHGLPRLADTLSEHWTPQMLSLEHLNAFSLKKGCYPGQEIVARTHYLGQAKRQTKLVQAQYLNANATINRVGEKVGELICINSTHDKGLAILQNVTDSDVLVCGEHNVKSLQALTGLQRSN
ncbi:MAG: folate-binding protein [Arenimonas sp.]